MKTLLQRKLGGMAPMPGAGAAPFLGGPLAKSGLFAPRNPAPPVADVPALGGGDTAAAPMPPAPGPTSGDAGDRSAAIGDNLGAFNDAAQAGGSDFANAGGYPMPPTGGGFPGAQPKPAVTNQPQSAPPNASTPLMQGLNSRRTPFRMS